MASCKAELAVQFINVDTVQAQTLLKKCIITAITLENKTKQNKKTPPPSPKTNNKVHKDAILSWRSPKGSGQAAHYKKHPLAAQSGVMGCPTPVCMQQVEDASACTPPTPSQPLGRDTHRCCEAL